MKRCLAVTVLLNAGVLCPFLEGTAVGFQVLDAFLVLQSFVPAGTSMRTGMTS
jgi:hypothetical protein